MIPEVATLYVAFLFLTAAATAGLAVYGYRNRTVPGAVPFVALMASLTLWSGGYAVGSFYTDVGARLVVERVQWLGLGTVTLWSLLFALAYTGYDRFVTRRSGAVLGAVPAAAIVGAWTNHYHGLMWTDYATVVIDGFAVVDATPGPLLWLFFVYAWVLLVATSVLVVRLVFVSDFLYTDQSVLLVVGIATPLIVSLVDVLAFEGPTIDPTPFAFAITGFTFGYALFYRRLFDLVPATRQLGRNAAIAQLEDGVVIADGARRVVYCNAAAGEMLGADPAESLGERVEELVDEAAVDFETEDALAEIERDGRRYEVRTSPITDRRDRLIGHTLVVTDITNRKKRERELAAQRDELETVNDLNTVLRGVNRGLVSATNRAEIERTVCERVVDADLYRTACVGDVATWTGDADRWTVTGDGDTDRWDSGAERLPPSVDDDLGDRESGESADGGVPIVPGADEAGGTWAVVPLVYGQTVYGALGLYTDRADIGDRERAVLGELGETVGHAINAVETRRLLSAEAVVELELRCADADDPLVTASGGESCRLDVSGVVPGRDGDLVAYVQVDGADPASVRDRMDGATEGTVRSVREDEARGLLEWQVGGDDLLRVLDDHGAHVQRIQADDGVVRYHLEIASEADVRSLADHVEGTFADTRIVSKRERTDPVDPPDALPADDLDDLTDRQQEALEAAYRAGYFNWPRDSTAEEVAETLGITSATLHSHLRKAQSSLLTDVFDGRPGEAGSD